MLWYIYRPDLFFFRKSTFKFKGGSAINGINKVFSRNGNFVTTLYSMCTKCQVFLYGLRLQVHVKFDKVVKITDETWAKYGKERRSNSSLREDFAKALFEVDCMPELADPLMEIASGVRDTASHPSRVDNNRPESEINPREFLVDTVTLKRVQKGSRPQASKALHK